MHELELCRERFVDSAVDVNSKKGKILNVAINPARRVATFRRNGLMTASLNESRTIVYDAVERLEMAKLLKLLHSDYDETKSLNEFSKLLSSKTHRFGFVVIRNVFGRCVEYDISKMVNKPVTYQNGITNEIIEATNTIKISNRNVGMNVSVELYDDEFAEDAKCYYYILETLDGTTYAFLTPFGCNSLAVDATLVPFEWPIYVGRCNELFERFVVSRVDGDLSATAMHRISKNKYDINFTDMVTYILDKLNGVYSRSQYNTEIYQILNQMLQHIVDYLAIHVSNMEKLEIYCVIISEKHKLFKHLLFEISNIKTESPVEFQIKLFDAILNSLSDSKMFDLLYFKESLVVW